MMYLYLRFISCLPASYLLWLPSLLYVYIADQNDFSVSSVGVTGSSPVLGKQSSESYSIVVKNYATRGVI